MIGYASRTGTKRNLAALRAAGWRIMVSAKGVLRAEGFPYALDNGAWTAYVKDQEFDVDAFQRAVDMLGAGADWVVVPDIVAGGIKSLDYSLSWVARLKGFRLMLAVQDGMTPADVEPHLHLFDGIFVGGSTAWKLDTLAVWGTLAHKHRKLLHVGRVNTARRIALCHAAGATSFDGSSASRFAKTLPLLNNASHAADLFNPRTLHVGAPG